MQLSEGQVVRHKLVDYLSRREHSQKELVDKLTLKGFACEVILAQLAELQDLGLQSDERFTASFTRMRLGQGKGLAVIRQDLQQRGIEKSVIEAVLAEVDVDWSARACQVRQRKFGVDLPLTPKDKARQLRFLAARGFSAADAYAAISYQEGLDDL